MPAAAAKQAYTRKEVLRLLGISERQLVSWEQQKLVASTPSYGFRELLALRTILKLRADRVPALQLRKALAALRQKLKHVENPLTDLKLYADGKKVRVEIDGGAMEAVSGQLLLNFGKSELKRLVEFPQKSRAATERDQRATAERWFQRGLDLEQSGAPAEQVIEAYQKAIGLDPNSAGALVNLGTIYFNARKWSDAEKYYRQALEVDPEYALAHFDLANLYDERGDRTRALTHYEAALKISPNYADAHYNVALLYQGSNQPMKAVQHWTTYLKLDPASHWATIARRELAKLRESTVLPGSRISEPRG
ncbi:MAG TPA: tetratricopeptide repeat protein [Bryobacteraceae bacterium]|nr:tetratricopeptide repeat protein [Bryobacteraceae bacterium]